MSGKTAQEYLFFHSSTATIAQNTREKKGIRVQEKAMVHKSLSRITKENKQKP